MNCYTCELLELETCLDPKGCAAVNEQLTIEFER